MRASLPLYVQIESVLRQRVRSGHYPAGGRFPTDEKVRAEFKVSRATVRLALDALHRDGLIVRYPGRGTFVNDLRDRVQVLRFEGSVERVLAHGDGAGTEHFVVERTVASPTLLEAGELKLENGRLVVRFTGFRRRAGQRLGYVVIALPQSTGALLDVREGQAYPSIVAMLAERLGLVVCEIRQVISAALANPGIAAALGIPVGAPLLTIRRTHYGAGGTPLELAVTSYPADRYQYEATITGMA
jgi:GntR family transcriptional regulator